MTTTKIKPYRVVRVTIEGPHTLLDQKFGTREEAEEFAYRQSRSTYYTYQVVDPDDVRQTVAKIKAKNFGPWLRQRATCTAVDFDDARPRLMKLADVADRYFARQRELSFRKGWLKTETGLAFMYDAILVLQERRRISSGNLTPEETARLGRTNTRTQSTLRGTLMGEFDEEYDEMVLQAALTSIHADEY